MDMRKQKTSAERWWCDWAETNEGLYELGTQAPYASSAFDPGDPVSYPSAAEKLMDMVCNGEEEEQFEDEEYVPYGIAGVRDQQGSTVFVFNDGSSIEFSSCEQWWHVNGHCKMWERYEYAFNEQTGKIEQAGVCGGR